MTTTPDPRRRAFVKMGAAGALSAAALAAGPAAAHPAAALPKKWDETRDVLVVGTGFAGLAAALEAKAAGADVLVIDKMPVFGGNSAINGGDFCAPGTRLQKEAGVQDSPELLLKDMLKAGAYLNHPALAKMVADQALDAITWCETAVGAKFTRLNFHGGHSVKRANQTDNASGSGLVTPMLQKCRAAGVRLESRVKLVRLYADRDGRVVGAEVRRGYRFGDERSGTTATIRARRAVVLASGGFANDVAMRQMHDPRLTDRFDSTNHAGATGEAQTAAQYVGAMDVQMDWIQLGPWTSPDEKGFGHVPQFCERVVGYGPMIDPATGRRFFRETGNRKERADAIILLGHPVLILADATTTAAKILPGTLKGGMENGAIRSYGSLEEIAKAYGIPEAAFVAEVRKFNGFVEARKDADFDCMFFPDSKPQVTPPFYVARLWPRVHHTMGGLAIDTQARVLGFDRAPIRGLYAAGEATGGVHGAVRLGSVAMADCVVFGRIAGRNAAAEAPAA